MSFIFLLFSLTFTWAQPAEREASDRYFLTFDANDPNRIHVRALVTLEDSLLYMSPYGPMPERWPQYIHDLIVKGPNGQSLALRRTEEGTWIVPRMEIGQKVVLSYQMALDHEEITWPGGIDGVAYRRDWGVMATGRSLFVMNGKGKRDIKVSIEAPENWNVSTSWTPEEGQWRTFRVPNMLNLQESFVVAGTHGETDITREGFTLKFVLGGEKVEEQAPRYVQVAASVMDYYIGLMGGIPKPRPGMELNQSLVLISQSEHVDGEVIGNHLSMFMDPEGSPMDQMAGWFMFAHEFFHLWNGKTLRFASTTTEWFKEGVSNYYTCKALTQTGFIDEDTLLAILNNLFYQRYLNDPGYGTLSPSRSASGFDKDNHWGLVYGGGLFAGIAMDMEIRHSTANSTSLDDLMRAFYREFGGTENLIGQEDIVSKANQLGSTDFSDFIREHIQGPKPISLAPYLKFAGISVATAEGQLQLAHKPEKTALQAAIWEGFLGAN